MTLPPKKKPIILLGAKNRIRLRKLFLILGLVLYCE